jgi:hypothetical protein
LTIPREPVDWHNRIAARSLLTVPADRSTNDLWRTTSCSVDDLQNEAGAGAPVSLVPAARSHSDPEPLLWKSFASWVWDSVAAELFDARSQMLSYLRRVDRRCVLSWNQLIS